MIHEDSLTLFTNFQASGCAGVLDNPGGGNVMKKLFFIATFVIVCSLLVVGQQTVLADERQYQ